MYIYDLPYDVNKKLCRLLDNDDDWKELAGVHMKYTAFEVNEIEQSARRLASSPTALLLTRWGQLNHRVEELYILLYHMKHVPAMQSLTPAVDARYQTLLRKLITKNGIGGKDSTAFVDDAKKQKLKTDESSIPLPVFEKGIHVNQAPPTSSNGLNGNSPTDDSTSDLSKTVSSTQDDRANDVKDEIMRNVLTIPMLKYDDLKAATDNWSDANLLGRGGFGQVFKGVWLNSLVAIKRLRDTDARNRELIRELCLNQYRHDNILPLYGYSFGGAEACLVYQFMACGSLEQKLRSKSHYPPLTWSQRYRIAHGVARGLQYLHTMTGTPLIHGDIKPANILLDQCLMPKIGDFGLARKGPYGEERTHLKVSRVHGTRPYLPDEYLRSRCLSPAVDVFSYGVVMVEIASCLPPIDRNRPVPLLSDWIQQQARDGLDFASLEDRLLQGTPHSNPGLCREFVAIGVHCTKYSRGDRPTMLEVYKRLDNLEFPGKHYM
ncbi:serine/threonine-protein kinase pelle isoform X1 [Galleria mellonella]|uniref:non-specific serine/threonine protein kinase n=2 Tax=Galleria mellonella TaxID=7137 RepID=A0A6J1WID7_GALME|nr:serine/threonine-protein kinase pelle isoform X1 [Galleria mellonella]